MKLSYVHFSHRVFSVQEILGPVIINALIYNSVFKSALYRECPSCLLSGQISIRVCTMVAYL